MRQLDIQLATGVSRAKLILWESDEGWNPKIDDLLAVVAYIGCPLGSVIRHPKREGPWVAG